jgi:hypothetical protein
MIGVATLLPPSAIQPNGRPLELTESYTATPGVGSASADTSFSVRFSQSSGAFCQDGLGSRTEQPDPAPLQAD